MRERGVLKPIPELLVTIRECTADMAVKAWESGVCDENYFEKKAVVRAAAVAAGVPVDIIKRRRR